MMMVVLTLSTLACTFLGPNASTTSRRIVMLTRLPTFTPTSLPGLLEIATATVPLTQSADVPPPQPPPAETLPLATSNTTSLPLPTTTLSSVPTSLPEQPVIPTTVPVSSAQNLEAMASTPPLATLTPVTTLATPLPSQPTATPEPDTGAGWSFVNVQIYPNSDEESSLLYGDVINNTGAAQHLKFITGNFYDAQVSKTLSITSCELGVSRRLKGGGLVT
jgi:hypothetical protein